MQTKPAPQPKPRNSIARPCQDHHHHYQHYAQFARVPKGESTPDKNQFCFPFEKRDFLFKQPHKKNCIYKLTWTNKIKIKNASEPSPNKRLLEKAHLVFCSTSGVVRNGLLCWQNIVVQARRTKKRWIYLEIFVQNHEIFDCDVIFWQGCQIFNDSNIVYTSRRCTNQISGGLWNS